MATTTQAKSCIDVGFSGTSGQSSNYEKHLDFFKLSELNINELNEWIDDYIRHLPFEPNRETEETPFQPMK
jgi:hypothetical protein